MQCAIVRRYDCTDLEKKMKKNKKLLMISFLLCAMVAIGAGAVACGEQAQESTPQSSQEPPEPNKPNLDHVTEVINDEAEFKKIFQSSEAGAKVEGYYLLGCDITLTEPWTNTAILAGTLDGGGYTISGLSLSANAGLFSGLENATIKEVAVVDVLLNGEQSGVFAPKASVASFENVYVSILNTLFSEYYETTQNNLVLSNQSQKGGLVCQGDNAEITVKDSVIYMPEFLPKAHGFVCAYGSPKLTITNSTFIGGNGEIVGKRSDKTTAPTYTNGGKSYKVMDAVKAYKDLYGKAICVNDRIMKDIPFDVDPTNANAWTDLTIKAYQANHPLKVFGPSHFTEENFLQLKSDIVVLKSNVGAGGTGLGISNDKGSVDFTGVFDGQCFEISGITTPGTQDGGLFKRLIGSVKNVSIKGKPNKTSGLVADLIGGNTYFENVYLEVDEHSLSSKGGALARWITSGTSLSMQDVVINVPDLGENFGAFAGIMLDASRSKPMGTYMQNCHCISWEDADDPMYPEKRPVGNRTKDDSYLSGKMDGVKYFFWDIGDIVDGVEMTEDDGLTWHLDVEVYLFQSQINQGKIHFSEFLTNIVLGLI